MGSVNKSKRDSIKLLASLFTIPIIFNIDKSYKGIEQFSSYKIELIECYKNWLNSYGEEPHIYLNGIHYAEDLKNIKAQMIRDFDNKDTFKIGGFVVSKTEAASLALLGKALIAH